MFVDLILIDFVGLELFVWLVVCLDCLVGLILFSDLVWVTWCDLFCFKGLVVFMVVCLFSLVEFACWADLSGFVLFCFCGTCWFVGVCLLGLFAGLAGWI